MSTVAEIVAAAARLSPDEFLELRRELNRLELRVWEKELDEAVTARARSILSEEEISRLESDAEGEEREEE